MTTDSGKPTGLPARAYTAPGMHHAVKLWYGIDNLGEVGYTAVYPPSWIRVDSVRLLPATLQFVSHKRNSLDQKKLHIAKLPVASSCPAAAEFGVQVKSYIIGYYHMYKLTCIWTPTEGEVANAVNEEGNAHNHHAIAILEQVTCYTVRHVPQKIFKDATIF